MSEHACPDRLRYQLEFAQNRLGDYLGRTRTYVYVLGCDGFVKVGIARNIKKRLNALRTGLPHPIEFLGMFPTIKAREDERDLHREYSEFRKLNEWFRLPDNKLERLLKRACYHYEDVQT